MNIPHHENARLQLWTIYNRGNYIARRSLTGDGAASIEHLMISTDLDALRRQMMQLGLHHRARHPDDQPDIVELWL